MIIQRISKGIKDQDWFVVGVEIMIVVVGIFIGLQVDDWNQQRLANREAGLFLTQLENDIEKALEMVESNNEGLERRAKFGLLLVDVLDERLDFEEHKEDFELGLNRIRTMMIPPLELGNLALLLNGNYSINVHSRDVIPLLQNLQSEIVRVKKGLLTIEEDLEDMDLLFYQYYARSTSRFSEIQMRYDLEKLKEDQFIFAVQESVRLFEIASRLHDRLSASLNIFLEENRKLEKNP